MANALRARRTIPESNAVRAGTLLAIRAQEEADEREYWEFRKASDALRKKYDPNNNWNEATPLPAFHEYLGALYGLHESDHLQRSSGGILTDDDAP